LHGRVPWGMHKFGGASLANAELYRTCGDILIAESVKGGTATPTAAVVSAMKGMTDKLIAVVETASKPQGEAAAKQKLDDVIQGQIATALELLPGHPELAAAITESITKDSEDILALLRSLSLLRVAPNSTMELVAGMGEIWSAQVLCAYLKTKGVPTAWVNAREVLVVEANDHGVGAKGAALEMRVDPLYDETANRLNAWWETEAANLSGGKPPVVVVAGFVCCTLDGVPTTLKRSGSDYSATIFAKLLKASQVTMWKNVDGVFAVDPGTVPAAKSVPEMSYEEAIELAYFGGQVLHPTAMMPAMEDDTPVYVRNVFNPDFPGTKITREGRSKSKAIIEQIDASPVQFFTSIPNIAMVNIQGGSWGSVSKVTHRAMAAMDEAGVKVVLVTQACASHSVSLAVDENAGPRAVEALRGAFELELARGQIEGVVHDSGYSIISAIGNAMKGMPGTLAKLTASLARCGVNVVAMAQGSSERNITLVVEKEKLKLGLAAAHAEFCGSQKSLASSVDEAIFSSWKNEQQRTNI